MNVVVSRASQVHQMPHTGRAHSGPVISPMVQHTTPTSTPDTPSAVPLALAGDEISDVGVKDDEKGAEHGDPAGNVEIKNALDGVHGLFVRRDEQRRIAREENQRGDEHGDCKRAFIGFGFLLIP